MKVSQSRKLRTLKVSSSAVAKTINAMMKLALIRTTSGKEDPELPLLQRIRLLEVTAPQTAAQINASQSSKKQTHLNTNCSEETE